MRPLEQLLAAGSGRPAITWSVSGSHGVRAPRAALQAELRDRCGRSASAAVGRSRPGGAAGPTLPGSHLVSSYCPSQAGPDWSSHESDQLWPSAGQRKAPLAVLSPAVTLSEFVP